MIDAQLSNRLHGLLGVWPVMLAKLTRWLEAGLPVEFPLVTLLKARRSRRAGIGGVAPATSEDVRSQARGEIAAILSEVLLLLAI